MIKFRPDELKNIVYPICVMKCVIGLNGCDKIKECESKLKYWQKISEIGD